MIRALLTVSLFVFAAGCVFGPSVRQVQRDLSPAGTHAEITLRTVRIEGELLALHDDGLLLLNRTVLTLVPFTSIMLGRFEWSRAPQIVNGQPPSAGQSEKIRLLSRYPQGVDEDLMNRLLVIYGQDEVRVSE